MTLASASSSTSLLPLELRASFSLASIFAMRMLGLFLVLPVFALEAVKYPGGDDPARVGLAMGIYGLTQGILQIPFGMASDRFGRKKVILIGLLIFALGSFLAAWAPTLNWLIAGRSLQGAGAISAAVTALLADLTRDEVRTKAMALVGASIGLMFALSLVLAPWLATQIGLSGLFALTGVLVILCMAVVIWAVPPEPALTSAPSSRLHGLKEVLTHANLLRLDLGAFILHAVQLAMWVAIPAMLVQAGLAKAAHWQVYLPAVLLSFVLMGGLFALEARGHLKAAFLGGVGLIGLVQLGLWWALNQAPNIWLLGFLLFAFFVGFNVLEASQPSLASRVAPAHARGAALGVYNTVQSLGFFVGGFGGGWLAKHYGFEALFAGCFALMLIWLVAAWGMKPPARSAS
ncbi:MFS transporter [Variovorax sp. PCZ-1]|uniref:MFS transporter n=1 Tax=Variovorax sp. PCZ-1 TaxID=2835533 RepID=UPI001BCB0176|nr:MFS transporter [Variovorax sp. PCZ-1]MBS7808636.1 MFS transporter [Variovorax sp. PCZ-1]